MGFYGEVVNTGEAPFTFDKIYSNRYHMEKSMTGDGIYSGRFVLISYDTSYTHNNFKQVYIKEEDINKKNNIYLYKDSSNTVKVKYKDFDTHSEKMSDILAATMSEVYYVRNENSYIYYKCIGYDDDGAALFNYYTELNQLFFEAYRNTQDNNSSNIQLYLSQDFTEENLIKPKSEDSTFGASKGDIYFVREYDLEESEKEKTQGIYSFYECTNFYKDSITNKNNAYFKKINLSIGHYQDETIENYIMNQKLDALYFGQNYDKTVWQKIYVGDKEKYIKVASLNSKYPNIYLSIDAPEGSVSTSPYLDADVNGSIYDLHIQPSWGFRVAAANKALSLEGSFLNPSTGNYISYTEKINNSTRIFLDNILNIEEAYQKGLSLSKDLLRTNYLKYLEINRNRIDDNGIYLAEFDELLSDNFNDIINFYTSLINFDENDIFKDRLDFYSDFHAGFSQPFYNTSIIEDEEITKYYKSIYLNKIRQTKEYPCVYTDTIENTDGQIIQRMEAVDGNDIVYTRVTNTEDFINAEYHYELVENTDDMNIIGLYYLSEESYIPCNENDIYNNEIKYYRKVNDYNLNNENSEINNQIKTYQAILNQVIEETQIGNKLIDEYNYNRFSLFNIQMCDLLNNFINYYRETLNKTYNLNLTVTTSNTIEEIYSMLAEIFNLDYMENIEEEYYDENTISPIPYDFQSIFTDCLMLSETIPEEESTESLIFYFDKNNDIIDTNSKNVHTSLCNKIQEYVNDKGSLKSDENITWETTITDQENNSIYYTFDGFNWNDKNNNFPGDIYYNKAGFDYRKTHKDDTLEDSISIKPSGFSQIYDQGNEVWINKEYSDKNSSFSNNSIESPDTQELSIHLPSLGNAMSDIWDLIYGEGEENDDYIRKTDVSWDTSQRAFINRTRLIENNDFGYTYSKDKIATVAGAINTAQDLIGRIIIEDVGYADIPSYTCALDIPSDIIQKKLSNNYIYYFSDDNRYYDIRNKINFDFSSDKLYTNEEVRNLLNLNDEEEIPLTFEPNSFMPVEENGHIFYKKIIAKIGEIFEYEKNYGDEIPSYITTKEEYEEKVQGYSPIELIDPYNIPSNYYYYNADYGSYIYHKKYSENEDYLTFNVEEVNFGSSGEYEFKTDDDFNLITETDYSWGSGDYYDFKNKIIGPRYLFIPGEFLIQDSENPNRFFAPEKFDPTKQHFILKNNEENAVIIENTVSGEISATSSQVILIYDPLNKGPIGQMPFVLSEEYYEESPAFPYEDYYCYLKKSSDEEFKLPTCVLENDLSNKNSDISNGFIRIVNQPEFSYSENLNPSNINSYEEIISYGDRCYYGIKKSDFNENNLVEKYVPGKYYYSKESGFPSILNYYLDISEEGNPHERYFSITDVQNVDLITYEPGKYFIKENNLILPSMSLEFDATQIYYKHNQYYVTKNYANMFEVGQPWDWTINWQSYVLDSGKERGVIIQNNNVILKDYYYDNQGLKKVIFTDDFSKDYNKYYIKDNNLNYILNNSEEYNSSLQYYIKLNALEENNHYIGSDEKEYNTIIIDNQEYDITNYNENEEYNISLLNPIIVSSNNEKYLKQVFEIWKPNKFFYLNNYYEIIQNVQLVNEDDLQKIYYFKELTGFGRNYNTINGLILEFNKVIGDKNSSSRDMKTLYGVLNKLNDEAKRLELYDSNTIKAITQSILASYQTAQALTNEINEIRAQAEGTYGGLLLELEASKYYTNISDFNNLIGIDLKSLPREKNPVLYSQTYVNEMNGEIASSESEARIGNYVFAESKGNTNYYKKVISLNPIAYEMNSLIYQESDGVQTYANLQSNTLKENYNFITDNIISEINYIKNNVPTKTEFQNIIGIPSDTTENIFEISNPKSGSIISKLLSVSADVENFKDALYGFEKSTITYINLKDTTWTFKPTFSLTDNYTVFNVNFESLGLDNEEKKNYNSIVISQNGILFDQDQFFFKESSGWLRNIPKEITFVGDENIFENDSDFYIWLRQVANLTNGEEIIVEEQDSTTFNKYNSNFIEGLNTFNEKGILARLTTLDSNLNKLSEEYSLLQDELLRMREAYKRNVLPSLMTPEEQNALVPENAVGSDMPIKLLEAENINETYGFYYLRCEQSKIEGTTYICKFTIGFSPSENIPAISKTLILQALNLKLKNDINTLTVTPVSGTNYKIDLTMDADGEIYFSSNVKAQKLKSTERYEFNCEGRFDTVANSSSSGNSSSGNSSSKTTTVKKSFYPDTKHPFFTKYSFTQKTVNFIEGKNFTVPGSLKSISGCDFQGWCPQNNTSGTVIKPGTYKPGDKQYDILRTKNVFYAYYTPKKGNCLIRIDQKTYCLPTSTTIQKFAKDRTEYALVARYPNIQRFILATGFKRYPLYKPAITSPASMIGKVSYTLGTKYATSKNVKLTNLMTFNSAVKGYNGKPVGYYSFSLKKASNSQYFVLIPD